MVDNQHKRISGYRDLTQDEIDLMNRIKALETEVAAVFEEVEAQADSKSAGRWASLARTNAETAFMYAVKSVAKPTGGLGDKG